MKTIFDPSLSIATLVRRACGPALLCLISQLASAQQSIATWGFNSYGQLGDGTDTDRNTSVYVSGLSGVTAISGARHTLAVKNDGTVWIWGTWLLGNETVTSSTIPVPVSGLSGVTAVAAGFDHSLALRSDGTVWAWGSNLYGQLGNGTNVGSGVPVQVPGLSGVTAIVAGLYHNLALRSDGTVWAWGYNHSGEAGGTTPDPYILSSPAQVRGLINVTAIAAAGYHSLALTSDGTVWSWGDNQFGQLGNGTSLNSGTPAPVNGLSGVTAIAAGQVHGLAVKTDGTVSAWGYNVGGQLGNGTYDTSNVPVQVSGLTHVAAVAGGTFHSLALTTEGAVWAWGDNSGGELGNGTSIPASNTPVHVSGVIHATAIAGGWGDSLAIVDVYTAAIQAPIKADGASIFGVHRGVVPIRFALAVNGTLTCKLPPATISVTRTAGSTVGSINETSFSMASDSGSNFRIDTTNCQYVYNIGTSSLGAGTYQVRILISGTPVGDATFGLQQ